MHRWEDTWLQLVFSWEWVECTRDSSLRMQLFSASLWVLCKWYLDNAQRKTQVSSPMYTPMVWRSDAVLIPRWYSFAIQPIIELIHGKVLTPMSSRSDEVMFKLLHTISSTHLVQTKDAVDAKWYVASSHAVLFHVDNMMTSQHTLSAIFSASSRVWNHFEWSRREGISKSGSQVFCSKGMSIKNFVFACIDAKAEGALLISSLPIFTKRQGNEDSAHSDQPLKEGNVHISAPHIYGSVIEALSLVPNSCTSFLNIGSGTGYVSCIVAEILGPNSLNYGIFTFAWGTCSTLFNRESNIVVPSVAS